MIFFVAMYSLVFLFYSTLLNQKSSLPDLSKQPIGNTVEVKPEVLLGMHAAVTLDVVVNLHGHLDLLKLERKAGVYYSA